MNMCRSEFHATVNVVRRNFIEHVLNRKIPGQQYNDVYKRILPTFFFL